MVDCKSYRVLRVLREMAWQRAKGELGAMLGTFYEERKEFTELKDKIELFVEAVEEGYDLSIEMGTGT